MNSEIQQKIRESILQPERMLDKTGNVKELNVMHNMLLNCYAYALGIMYVNPKVLYNFGFMTGEDDSRFCKNGVISEVKAENMMKSDLKELGLKCRKFNLNDKIELEDNEYLIKWYYCNIEEGDIHFFRQDPESGIWFHKPGRMLAPQVVGSEPGPIWKLYDVLYRERGYFAISAL